MAGLGPRVLQVLEFANARAPELQALHELSQHDKFSDDTDDKIKNQKNQRRRRANAFKSHRMPQRLRAAPKKSGSLRCRKHERRPHTLLQERSSISKADADRPLWLPSHLYHAKRMAMVARYGYILAAHRSDKSVSAALQAVRTKATIHDVSYYGVIELYGLPSVILTALQLISDPNGSDFHGRRFLAGDGEGHSMLYHVGRFPQGAIAPVTFMWRPLKRDYDCDRFMLQEDWQNTKRQLWLWVHPAAYMEAATAIATACQEVDNTDTDSIEMLDRRGQLCRLKLRGRIADELVASIASDVVDTISKVDKDGGVDDQDAQDQSASDHEDGFDKKETVDRCCRDNRRSLLRAISQRKTKKQQGDDQKDSIYAVAVKDPRLARWKKGALCHPLVCAETGLSLLNEPPAHAVPDVGSEVIESPLSGISLSSLGKAAEEPDSELIIKELLVLLSWTTCSANAARMAESDRLQYPSAVDGGEQSKLDAIGDDSEMDDDPTPNSLLWSSSRRCKIESNFIKDHKLNEEIFRQRKGIKLGHSLDALHVKSQAVHLLVIKKHEPYPYTSGWDIICLPSSVSSILKTLVFGGAMVVGLEEDAALHTVLHQPSFPCDYPDTQSGQVYWEAHARDLEIKQAKKPRAKRFDNAKHGVNSSFRPRWELLFDEQKPENGVGDEDRVLPCVIRGETYLKPFSFYRSRNAAADVDEATSLPTSGINYIVSVATPTLVRVVVIVPRRGNINVNAMLFAPSAEDVDKYKNDDSWNGFNAGLEKKNRVTTVEKDERSLIGFVTSVIYDRPKGAFRAVGFIACEPLQQLFVANEAQQYRKQHHCALAMFRSPQGRMVRPVLVQVET